MASSYFPCAKYWLPRSRSSSQLQLLLMWFSDTDDNELDVLFSFLIRVDFGFATASLALVDFFIWSIHEPKSCWAMQRSSASRRICSWALYEEDVMAQCERCGVGEVFQLQKCCRWRFCVRVVCECCKSSSPSGGWRRAGPSSISLHTSYRPLFLVQPTRHQHTSVISLLATTRRQHN